MLSHHLDLCGEYRELIFIDDASDDGSSELLSKLAPRVRIKKLISNVGVGKAFYAGAIDAKGKYVLFLPVDCILSVKALNQLILKIKNDRCDVLMFRKMYDTKKALFLYRELQNYLLLKVFRVASWTNGICVHSDLVGELEPAVQFSFLCDLEFSKRLKKFQWKVIDSSICVSVRRYINDGILSRIGINGLILFLWFFKLSSNDNLKKFYSKK